MTGRLLRAQSDLSLAGGDPSLGKEALLPGNTATFQNYTSYVRGINGIIVDINSLATTPTLATIGDFFEFRVGNSNDFANGFSTAPTPIEIDVRVGEGDGGSDRVTIVWADNAIENQWLEVTVLANASTGLVTEDIHYWGNIIGEVGNQSGNTLVNATDQGQTRDNFTLIFQNEAIESAFDFNRDGLTNATDQGIARDNFTMIFQGVNLISPPAPPQSFASGGASSVAVSAFIQPLSPSMESGDSSAMLLQDVQLISSPAPLLSLTSGDLGGVAAFSSSFTQSISATSSDEDQQSASLPSTDQPTTLPTLSGSVDNQGTELEGDAVLEGTTEGVEPAEDTAAVLDEAFGGEHEFWDIF